MKWYFAINQAGSEGVIGTHAKCAVLSARRNTRLVPHLLYSGARNAFTAWMERHGVTVIDVQLSFADAIGEMAKTDARASVFIGHWLRSNLCLIERDEAAVLYTDCDVVFRSHPEFGGAVPPFFASAPEFREDDWSYCNSGVMLMNVAAMRDSFPAFQAFILERLMQRPAGHFLDQDAYNQFYAGRWSRLDPLCNWKPYWGANQRAPIVHFHGPKLSDLHHVLDGGWNWEDAHMRQIGTLFLSGLAGYLQAVRLLLASTEGAELPEREEIRRLEQRLLAGKLGVDLRRIDLSFLRLDPSA